MLSCTKETPALCAFAETRIAYALGAILVGVVLTGLALRAHRSARSAQP